MSSLSITRLRFAYPDSPFRLKVDALHVEQSGRFALLGPSGAGKTTLLRLMTGLLSPGEGSVKLGSTELSVLTESQRRCFRLREIGLVFQDFALLDYLTVAENIVLPQRFTAGSMAAEAGERGRDLAERLQIAAHWHRLAGQLSQGERQRVAIARALAHRPKFVFADEPTASLDADRRSLVMELLLDYTREAQACLVMVTHDPELMSLFPHRARVEDFTTLASPSFP